MKLMIIEDDVTIRNELTYFLETQGYDVYAITDFKTITQSIIQQHPDLILLDLTLPYVDGFHLCKELRKDFLIPIIVVTSRNTQIDELMSMNLGADDFITKPYHLQILLARLEAVLKRSYKQETSNKLIYSGLVLDLNGFTISYQNKKDVLSKNEIKILTYLIQNKGTVVTREDLMENLWSSEIFIDDNTLSVNMTRLRKKIEQLGMKDPINTKRGIGYLLP